MKINITYTARDGRSFSDPFECEEYEKTLGVVSGSVRDAIIKLKRLPQDYLANFVIVIWDENRQSTNTYHYISMKLPDGREITCSLAKAIDNLEALNMNDAPCQYTGDIFDSFDYTNIYLIISSNPDLMTKINSTK